MHVSNIFGKFGNMLTYLEVSLKFNYSFLNNVKLLFLVVWELLEIEIELLRWTPERVNS